jgi:UDP-glucuronate 4-epimerase
MLASNLELKNKTILVTGAAGFIGSGTGSEAAAGKQPGPRDRIDNMNDYYDVSIKEYRLAQIDREVRWKEAQDSSDGKALLPSSGAASPTVHWSGIYLKNTARTLW